MSERLLNVREVAARLSISKRGIYRLLPKLLAQGLQERRIGGRRLFREASLDKLIAGDDEACVQVVAPHDNGVAAAKPKKPTRGESLREFAAQAAKTYEDPVDGVGFVVDAYKKRHGTAPDRPWPSMPSWRHERNWKPMSKKRLKLSEQVRRAVDASSLSRYAICKAAGVDKAVVSRFMAGKVGLSIPTLDALANVLGLNIVAGGAAPTGRKAGKK